MRRSLWLLVVVSCLLSGLTTTAEAGVKKCPRNTTSDIYVNPHVRYPDGVRATGVASPRYCAFKTITKGSRSATDRGLPSGRIILRGGKESSPASLGRERFPLALPDNFTLTTADDPVLDGAALDASHYVVKFKGAATHALSVTNGEIRGITLRNARKDADALAMVRCNSGTSSLDTVVLDGVGPDGGTVDTGVELVDGCETELTDSLVRRFADDGIVVEHGALLTSRDSDVIGNADEGVWIAGEADLSGGELSYNGARGIFVEQSIDAHFDSLQVHDNQHGGFYVQPAIVEFMSNDIFHNAMAGVTSTAPQSDPQMVFSGQGPYTSAETVQVTLQSGTTTMPRSHAFALDPNDDRDATNGDASACAQGLQNYIFGFNVSDAGSANSVGLRGINNALVFANNQVWAHTTSSQNVSAGAGSFVEASYTCGTIGAPVIDVAFPGPNPYF